MFNNKVFSCAMIVGMRKKAKAKISPQMERLYDAARILQRTEGKSKVATLINCTPYMLNIWEDGRLISFEGLIKAQEFIGCNALWVRDGKGEMRVATDDAREFAKLFDQLDSTEQTATIQNIKGLLLLKKQREPAPEKVTVVRHENKERAAQKQSLFVWLVGIWQ
jgi:hypothetical protein